jgi:hypothetical protein
MPAKPAAPAPADVLADFRVAQPRRAMYAAADGAPRASVPAVSDVAYVTRGAHVKSGAPVLMIVDGSAQSALTLSAIGAAIAGGVISKPEIAALLGES